jgi:hypothetical protein
MSPLKTTQFEGLKDYGDQQSQAYFQQTYLSPMKPYTQSHFFIGNKNKLNSKQTTKNKDLLNEESKI